MIMLSQILTAARIQKIKGKFYFFFYEIDELQAIIDDAEQSGERKENE